MKSKFEKIKELLADNGFEVKGYDTRGNDVVLSITDLNDPFKDVKFVECVYESEDPSPRIIKGRVYRVNPNGNGVDYESFIIDEEGEENGYGGANREKFKPATEEAYVNQMQKKVLDIFGNFFKFAQIDHSMMYGGMIEANVTWRYREDTDTLYWYGVPVYQDGVFAKKLKEKITVVFDSVVDDYYNGFGSGFWFNLSEEYKNVDFDGAGEVLAKTLEEYLNR